MKLKSYHVNETYESVFMSPKDRLGTIVDPRHRILYNHFPKAKQTWVVGSGRRVDIRLGNHDCILPISPSLP